MANDLEKRVTAKIVLDDTGFNSTLKGVNAGIKETKSEFKAASEGIKTYGKNTEQLKSAQQALGRQLEQQAKKVNLYKEAMQKSSAKMQENIKARDKLKASLDKTNKAVDKAVKGQSKELEAYRKNETALEKLTKKYDSAKKSYGENSEASKKLKEQISKLEAEQQKLVKSNAEEIASYKKVKDELHKTEEAYSKKARAVEADAKATQKHKTSMNNANAELLVTQNRLNTVNRDIATHNNKWLGASKALSNHSEKLKSVGGAVDGVGSKMLWLTAPIAAVGGAAIKVSADFEAGMSEVQAISGATGEDLDKLKEKAKEMGATTKFSASESAEALKFMAMAGWKTNDMLDGLEGVMNLAAASGEDLATTSDIVTDALTAFGLQAKDSGHFSDVLASASSNANTNVSLLGESFKYCAPVCGAMKMSAEDTAVALGLMANAGIKGSTAGTVLRTTLTNLAKPTDTVAKYMDQIGLSLTDNAGKVKPLSTLMNELREKMGGLTEAQQAEVAAGIAGKEAMSGLLAIVNASPADYDKLTGAIKKCDGTSKSMADTMNNNLKGQWTLFKSQLEGVGIQLGQTLLPLAKKGLDVISKWVDWFSKLSPEMQETIVKTGLFGVATGGVLKIVGKGIGTVGDFVGVLAKVAPAMGKIISKAPATASAVTAVTEGLGVVEGAGVGATAAVEGTAVAVGTATATFTGAALAIASFGTLIGFVGKSVYDDITGEVVPAVDLFADEVDKSTIDVNKSYDTLAQAQEIKTIKICESTKKAVGAYMDLDSKAGNALMDLMTKSDNFTEQTKEDVMKNYEEMSKGAVGHSDKMRKDLTKDMQLLVQGTKKLTKENKDKIIQEYKTMLDGCTNMSKEQKTNVLKNIQETLDKSTTMTKEEVEHNKQLYKDMTNHVSKNVEERKNKEISTLQKMFATTKALTKEEQEDIMKKTTDHWNKKTEKVAQGEAEIDKIFDNAAKEHRNITEEEAREIEKIKQGMKEDAVKIMSENELETKVILERLKGHDEHITAEQASEHIKKVNELRDKSVEAANQQCDETIKEAIRQRDETGNMTAEQADKVIEEAKRQRDEAVNAAEDLRSQAVTKIQSMDDSIKSNVSETSGTVRSDWENMKSWWANWHPVQKIFEIFTKHTSDGKSADSNWTGNSHFQGGFTTLHERGWELYDLPSGSRIYNHDASERMVLETAKETAKTIAAEMLNNSNSSNGGDIVIPINIAGEEIDRVVVPRVSNRLATNTRRYR